MKIKIDSNEMFIEFLKENETWLMEKILQYAKMYNYTKYTSTLIEAWRISIVGLTNSLELLMDQYEEVPEMGPDESYEGDPAYAFGLEEARLHRSRGVNLAMFFSLFKYYRQTYEDLLELHKATIRDANYFRYYLKRFFDRVEIAYISEWAGLDAEMQIHELSDRNRELANEKNRYLTFFDSMNNPAIIISEDGVIENYNLKAGQLFFEDNSAGKYYYNKESNVLIDALFPINSLEDETFEWHYNKMTFLVTHKKIHDVSGKYVGVIIMFNDITKLKQAQDLIVSQSRYAAMGEMISMIAHQWRQPLSVITMEVNNLIIDIELDTLDIKALQEVTNSINNQAQYLSETIDSFRDFFKTNQVQIQVPIEHMLKEIMQIIDSSLKYNHVHMHLQNKTEGLVVSNYKELIQVFVNIINNAKDAYKFSQRDHKDIHFLIASDKENIIMSVADKAGGIDPKIIDKIFDPYFTTKEELNGTGLGLYMSKTIIAEHFHGSIEVKDNDGGAVFVIKIPIEEKKL